MNRTRVTSSMISEIGYRPSVMTLELKFKNGYEYAYKAIPQRIFNELMASPSKGKYFVDNIKDKYECKRIMNEA